MDDAPAPAQGVPATSLLQNLCAELRFTGWDLDGGYATHIVVRADFAHRLPAGFPDLAAAPLLCGGAIGYRSLRVAGVDLADAIHLLFFLFGGELDLGTACFKLFNKPISHIRKSLCCLHRKLSAVATLSRRATP